MDRAELDTVWGHVDRERTELADLIDTFTPQEWEVPSLCDGWRVREVAAHLTQATTGLGPTLVAVVRARGRFDVMIRDLALRQAAAVPPEEYAGRIRAMVGSRRKAPGVTPLEPLIDVLVHTQDMLRPLGRTRAIDPDAGALALERAWSMGFPFHARKRLAGLHLVATDHPWQAGEGTRVEATVGELLLLATGRDVDVPLPARP